MKTDVLQAIYNIVIHRNLNIHSVQNYGIGINNLGSSFEEFIKDAFSNSFEINDKQKVYSEHFSYLGNQNNPIDLVLKNGDAFEIKKVEKISSYIALNSSYPKNKLYANDPKISKECRLCEPNWVEKDLCYIIGEVEKNQVKSIWFVYGECYSADRTVYEKVSAYVKEAVESSGLSFQETKELGKIDKVDPLGITYLRVRGMWHIKHPIYIFKTLPSIKFPYLRLILPKEKYFSFPEDSINKMVQSEYINIQEITIPNPNNPAKSIEAILVDVSL